MQSLNQARYGDASLSWAESCTRLMTTPHKKTDECRVKSENVAAYSVRPSTYRDRDTPDELPPPAHAGLYPPPPNDEPSPAY
ncbi:hypothetical protein CFIMG_007610RA00001 [Ceratocystis fimbriata CBS 114723]|uniref:Uncharacterized protein n=1 Tax=Ceratocystis fimbriata CBS 114723 TaxID=1035309 RepID=A0A2C5WVD3_9PEZI|nr:hypothetical protein CFIMG_007610RA00001 [Ceratocystis fimbriata CBS 114723]